MDRQTGQGRQAAKAAELASARDENPKTPTDGASTADQVKEPNTKPGPKPQTSPSLKPKVRSKADTVLALLSRRNGARMEEIAAATGWQPHSARAWLSGQRKQGLTIERSREGDGSSRYRLVPVAGGKPK